MTGNITLRYEDNLPMPLIFLHSAHDLAKWYISQLEWAIDQGHRDLTISCFDTAPMGYSVTDAAHAVLQEISVILANYSCIDHLTILCGDEKALRAYGQVLSEYGDF